MSIETGKTVKNFSYITPNTMHGDDGFDVCANEVGEPYIYETREEALKHRLEVLEDYPDQRVFVIEQTNTVLESVSDNDAQGDLLKAIEALGYNDYRVGSKSIDKLSDDDLRILYAYETWKDGGDWVVTQEIWLDEGVSYPRQMVLDQLTQVYGY